LPFSSKCIQRAAFEIHFKRGENITSSHVTLLRKIPVQVNYFNIKFSFPCRFTPIHMFNAIKANFPTTLLQAISVNTSLRKSLSQITPTLPSVSPASSVQLHVACPSKYFIVKNSGYTSSQIIKNIILTMKIYICAFKAVNHRRNYSIRSLRMS